MTVGDQLVAARQQAGLSVADVALSTRVRGSLIEAIESDDISGCGGVVYARGHVRNIATAVGADSTDVMAEFDRQHGAGTAVPTPLESEAGSTFRPDLAPSGRKGPNWLAAVAVAVIAVGALAGISLAAGSGDGRDTARSVIDASTGSPTPQAQASSTPPAPSPGPQAPTPPADALAEAVPGQVTLTLRITGATSWVRVSSAAGAQLFQGLLAQGETRTFTDPAKLNLILGDSGAVGLVVNGQDVGTAGGPGEVTRASFTPTDPAAQG